MEGLFKLACFFVSAYVCVCIYLVAFASYCLSVLVADGRRSSFKFANLCMFSFTSESYFVSVCAVLIAFFSLGSSAV